MKLTSYMTLIAVACISCVNTMPNKQAQQEDTREVKWSARYDYVQNEHDTAFGFYHYQLQSLSFYRNRNRIWEVVLPDRMRGTGRGTIYDKVPVDSSAVRYRKASAREIDVNQYKEFLLCPELLTSDNVVIAHVSGLLVLDTQNGRILIDRPFLKTRPFDFYVDEGEVSISKNAATCTGTIGRYAAFNLLCGNSVIVFNGYELFVIKAGRIADEVIYDPLQHLVNDGLSREARFRVDGMEVRVTGKVFVR